MKLKSGGLLFDANFSEAVFEPEKRVIRNVVLLGPTSKNNRKYSQACMTKSLGLFEGVQAFIDHPTQEEERSGRRSVRNLSGKYINARLEEGKVKADVMLLEGGNGDLYMNIARQMPDIAGNSQNAHGKWRFEGGVQVVEELTKVVSVDLVANPATTSGMFESDNIPNDGDNVMEYKDITKLGVQEHRPELFGQIIKEGAATRDDEVKKLTEGRDALKLKVDEFEVKEAQQVKAVNVAKLLKESKLPDAAKTEVFTESLLNIPEDKFEENAKKLIADREKAIQEATPGGVKNMGGESGEIKEGDVPSNEQAGKALYR